MYEDIALQIKQLEEKLLMPAIRKSIQELDLLLSDDFVEVARTGKKYAKSEIMEALQIESAAVEWTLSEFSIRMLSSEIVLANYLAKRLDKIISQIDFSFRSSIWIKTNTQWQMVFHQGTPADNN